MTTYAVGDPAYIDASRYQTVRVASGTVTKVTASGQVVVKHGKAETRFNSRGRELGAGQYDGARLIDEAAYERMLVTMNRQRAERVAMDACAEVGRVRLPTAANKAEILALIEAARIAVEAL